MWLDVRAKLPNATHQAQTVMPKMKFISKTPGMNLMVDGISSRFMCFPKKLVAPHDGYIWPLFQACCRPMSALISEALSPQPEPVNFTLEVLNSNP